jgi:7-carboxy-7-deazaguanine synthase
MYPVNEIYESIQGEGYHTGRASVFVRLQGCDVGCPWCDTKHTWTCTPEDRVDRDVMLLKTDKPASTFAVMEAADIVETAQQLSRSTRHVVITGGEPALHELRPLIAAFRDAQWSVQLETSGTRAVPMRHDYWMTLSPKIDMPGGLKVRASSWLRANEIKLPVGKQEDIAAFLEASREWFDTFKESRIYLQPLSKSPKATALCAEEAQRRGWYVSTQVNKTIGVR